MPDKPFSEMSFGPDSGKSNLSTMNYWPKYDPSIPVTIKNYSEDEIVRLVMDRLYIGTQASNYKKFGDELPNYHRAYEGKFKSPAIPRWRSQMFVRLAFRAKETLMAYFQDAFFGNVPYIHADPGDTKYRANARNQQKLFDYELYRTQFEYRYMDVFNYILKYGTAVTKTFWRFYVNYQHKADFKRNKFGFVERVGAKGKKYVQWDDPWFTSLDPRKVIPDPQARWTDEMRWVIEEYYTDLDQLVKDAGRYGYFNLNYLYNQQPGYQMYGSRWRFGNDTVSGTFARDQWSSRMDDTNRKRVFIDEYWGRLDLPGNQDDPRMYVVTLANNRNIIRLRPLPYAHGELPYQFHSMIRREESLYGIGAIEPILADNYILNALVNMRIDAMQYFINPRILVNRGALADRRSIEWSRPGELIGVNSGNDLDRAAKPLEIRDTGFNTWKDQLNFHYQHAEEVDALNPNASGVMAKSRRSATEAAQAMEGANARFTSMVKMMKFTGFDSLIRQFSQLMQQYVSPRKFPILNPESQEEKDVIMNIRPEDIQGEILIRIKDNTVTNKDIKQQLVNNLLGVLAPYAQALNMDIKPLVKSLMEISPVAAHINVDEVFPEALPEIMGQENAALERVGGTAGQAGQLPPGQPVEIPGENAGPMVRAEQMAGGMV